MRELQQFQSVRGGPLFMSDPRMIPVALHPLKERYEPQCFLVANSGSSGNCVILSLFISRKF